MRPKFLLAALLLPILGGAAPAPVTVFVAASLKASMSDISAAWARRGHPALRVSLDSSGTLAKQIEQGAGAQLFLSADEKWMDFLAHAGLIVPGSRKDLLTNTLVLVVPADSSARAAIAPGFDISGLLGPTGRLAVGDTATVPAGIYAKQALVALGVWAEVAKRLAPAANVTGALLLVETGEAPAGIVYATDARDDAKVRVIGTFPAASHDPIVYPIALVARTGQTPEARAALAFIEGRQGRAMFAAHGFGAE